MSPYFAEPNTMDIDSMSPACPELGSMRSNAPYPLRRGRACAVCRAHKIRCDGVRPVCGSCRRKPKADNCDWDSSQNKSRVAILIETIKELEARIFELEHPELVTPSVTLFYPYPRDEQEPLSDYPPPPDPKPRGLDSFPMTNFSPDSNWATTTPTIHTNASSVTSVTRGNGTGGRMEQVEYAPVTFQKEGTSRYFLYRKDGDSCATNSLSAALIPSRSC